MAEFLGQGRSRLNHGFSYSLGLRGAGQLVPGRSRSVLVSGALGVSGVSVSGVWTLQGVIMWDGIPAWPRGPPLLPHRARRERRRGRERLVHGRGQRLLAERAGPPAGGDFCLGNVAQDDICIYYIYVVCVYILGNNVRRGKHQNNLAAHCCACGGRARSL